MLAATCAVKDLAALCKELYHYQLLLKHNARDTYAQKGNSFLMPRVTKQAERAKVLVSKLLPDDFIQHCLDLQGCDLSYINDVSFEASASTIDFNANQKLFAQLKMFQACQSHVMRETGYTIEAGILTKVTAAAIQDTVDIVSQVTKTGRVDTSKLAPVPQRLTTQGVALDRSDLRRAAEKQLPRAVEEKRARMLGALEREKAKAYKAQVAAAEQFLQKALAQ